MEKPKKILIIEDDPDLGAMIKRLLSSKGYDSHFVRNGSSGIEKAFELHPDLILCDIQMKPIDGYQVYNILSESSLTKQIPFVFITGKSELEDIRFGLELGADDYLVKPFSNEELLKTIHTRISKHELLLNIGKSEFEALMELSPYATFIAEEMQIVRGNSSFLTLFGVNKIDKNISELRSIFNKESFERIENALKKCFNNIRDCFNEQIVIQGPDGPQAMQLAMSSTQKFASIQQVIGILTPPVVESTNGQASVNLDSIFNVLREEEVSLSENLTSKLSQIFGTQVAPRNESSMISFSKREQEVLKLSCDGLPIKLIADELCISDRTVEKYRASLMAKTNSKNIVEVLIYALKNNLVKI